LLPGRLLVEEFQQMSREIVQECYRRAAEAKRIADDASTPSEKSDFLEIEHRWLFLARSYETSRDKDRDRHKRC